MRPLVDHWTLAKNAKPSHDFPSKESKRVLLSFLGEPAMTRQGTSSLSAAISVMVGSFVASLDQGRCALDIPQMELRAGTE